MNETKKALSQYKKKFGEIAPYITQDSSQHITELTEKLYELGLKFGMDISPYLDNENNEISET